MWSFHLYLAIPLSLGWRLWTLSLPTALLNLAPSNNFRFMTLYPFLSLSQLPSLFFSLLNEQRVQRINSLKISFIHLFFEQILIKLSTMCHEIFYTLGFSSEQNKYHCPYGIYILFGGPQISKTWGMSDSNNFSKEKWSKTTGRKGRCATLNRVIKWKFHEEGNVRMNTWKNKGVRDVNT